MRRTAVRPRHDQVEELTRGVRLPLTAIADEHMEVLANGLRHAFEDVRFRAGATVVAGDEAEVTGLMQARLNRLIQEDSLWGQLVLYVGRGTESISFDGSHLEKRPDLSIVLSGRERRFPLVAEAKVLDTVASKTVAQYCKGGIRRFVEGEYAWAGREAFMIGYVRDGSSIDTTLGAFLARDSHSQRYRVEAPPVAVAAGSSDLAYTRHGRDFAYGGQTVPNSPGPISVWHLWLA